MGLIVSLAWNITNTIIKIKENKKKDEIDADTAKEKDIVKPIAPPKYYSTIEARRRNVKDGPYSVEGIADSLKNNLIPIGYSVEQLRKIGFGADVREYERRKKERIDKDNNDLIEGLEKLKKEIEKGIVEQKDLSEEDKELIKRKNIFNLEKKEKYISMINNWLGLAHRGILGDYALNSMLKVLNFRIDDYQDAIKESQIKKQNQELIDNAVLNRDKKILDSVKRAFRHGYLY